jgi:hypothetical protein
MKLNRDTCKKILKPCVCGNSDDFDFVSEQVCEDCCDVWIRCGRCGNDPASGAGEHIETAMGERDNFTASMAAAIWNSHISTQRA